MNSFPNAPLKIALFAFLLLFLAGCLISEFDEIRLTINKDGKSGTLEWTRRNVQSDESSKEKQNHDFNELLSNWKGDAYLVEKVSEGYYVKDRTLLIEKGVLVWKERMLFGDVHKIMGSDVSNDSIRIRLERSDVVISTNGVLQKYADSTIVTWPIGPGSFTLNLRRQEFSPTSDFVALFRESQRAARGKSKR